MPDYHIALEADQYYHIYNRAVGKEKLFIEEENYSFFLRGFIKYLSPIIETYSWCLLPNHFHFVTRVKSTSVIREYFKIMKPAKQHAFYDEGDFIMERFSNFFNSYVKSLNKKYNRKGGLFIDYMRRVCIKDDDQLCATIFYIHKNPVHHGLCKKLENWKWSSYCTILSKAHTNLSRQEVVNLFGGLNYYIEYHKQKIEVKKNISIEYAPRPIRF